MPTFVYGASGTGKSRYVTDRLREIADAGGRAYLLVPEQYAVMREAELARTLPASAQLYIEVVNFTRLADKVARRFGGFSRNRAFGSARISSGTKTLLMWGAIEKVAAELTEYAEAAAETAAASGRSADAFVAVMLDAVRECKRGRVTPDMLASAADAVAAAGSESSLAARLRDLSVVYTAYEEAALAFGSDPDDDMAALSAMLSGNDFFGGSSVFVDAFSGFTAAQYNVLEYIFAQADDVTVTFCCPLKRSAAEPHFRYVRETADRLRAVAASLGQRVREVSLTVDRRHESSPALAYLSRCVWSYGAAPYDGGGDEVAVVRCADEYEESRAIAREIELALRRGLRCREIAVVTRTPSRYDGVLDAELERRGIPCYFSRRESVAEMPAASMLLRALAVKAGGWRREDVLAYVRTGYCGVNDDDADAFERYVKRWNISRAKFLEPEWTMNPDGYVEELTEAGKAELARVNDVKKRICDGLTAFFDRFGASAKMPQACAACYEFLVARGVPDALRKEHDEAAAEGRRSDAQRAGQLWAHIVSALNVMASTLPDTVVDAARCATLLRCALDGESVGTIPTGADEVVIGDAALLRADNVKLCCVAGVTDGDFPAVDTDDGFFSDADKAALAKLGGFDALAGLGDGADSRLSRELFHFYRAVSCASERVVISYTDADAGGRARKPSSAVARVLAVVPDADVYAYGQLPDEEKIWSVSSGISAWGLERIRRAPFAPSLKAALEAAAENDASARRVLALAGTPIAPPDESLTPVTAERLYGRHVTLSPSRLDSYMKCRLGFYARYVLKLSDEKDATFGYADAGTFIHLVLERLISRFCSPPEPKNPTDEELAAAADEAVGDFVARVCRGLGSRSNRARRIFTRLRASAVAFARSICDEFSRSGFLPEYFELPLDPRADSESAVPSPKLTTDDGQARIDIYGKIDRLDVMRRGDAVYVRVVDYKTGGKNFKPERALEDDLQLLIYLFAVWRAPNGAFRRALAHGAQIIVPAGAVYFTAKPPEVTLAPGETDAAAKTVKTLSRKGLLLDDKDIISAQEPELKGEYIPVKVAKNGAISSDSLRSLAAFDEMCAEVQRRLRATATDMRSGDAPASPSDECAHCPGRAMCRRQFR